MAQPQTVSPPPPVRPLIVAGPCAGATIERHCIPAYGFEDYSSPFYALDVHLSHPYHLEWKDGRNYRRTWMQAGAICLAPPDKPISMRWNDSLVILSVKLEPSLLLRTAECMKLRGQLEIPESHGDVDPQLAGIAGALWAEAQNGYPTGRVFSESLVTAITSRVLQGFSVQNLVAPLENKLAPRAWRAVRDYIEDELDSDLSLNEMAEIAGLSPYHFARCFKETAGKTPHQYVISRRVERARQLLATSRLSLAQIALQCGFSDQSHLSRQFKRSLGVTPATLQSQFQIGRKNLQ
ncbi:AraC family transcriptional regulator [bacterium]|nr:MAG: AraC family transcriptional regulator [bacterium]